MIASYEQRLAEARERLKRLAEDQFAANPDDDRLFLLAAALGGDKTPLLEEDFPLSPLTATIACSWTLHGAPGVKFETPSSEDAAEVLDLIDTVFPTSSYGPLFKARWLVLNARKDASFWGPLTDALEQALARDSWDCPVRAFHVWSQEWLEKHEPDEFVRAAFDFRYSNLAISVLVDIRKIVSGAANGPATPRPEVGRLAAATRRLADRLAAISSDSWHFLLGQLVLRTILPSEFILAWRRGDVQEARRCSALFDEVWRREAAFDRFKPVYMKPFEVKNWAFAQALQRAFDPILEELRNRKDSAESTPEKVQKHLKEAVDDHDLRLEAARRMEAGAGDYLAALKADLVRIKPFLSEFGPIPLQHSKHNFLDVALQERDVLVANPLPGDRVSRFLDVVSDPDKVYTSDAEGFEAYEWTVREALLRPSSVPVEEVRRRFESVPQMYAMELAAVLKAQGATLPESWKPDQAQAREDADLITSYGYCVHLRDTIKASPPAAVPWLPEPEGATPSALEIVVAETLWSSTDRPFGLDWARWKTFLVSGK